MSNFIEKLSNDSIERLSIQEVKECLRYLADKYTLGPNFRRTVYKNIIFLLKLFNAYNAKHYPDNTYLKNKGSLAIFGDSGSWNMIGGDNIPYYKQFLIWVKDRY